MREVLGSVEGFQLVFVDRGWRDEDNLGILGLCCWVLNDGCQVFLVVVGRNMLGTPRHTGIIRTKEDCLPTSISI